ncbi:MAG: NIPSNAP family protein [Planctomycetota bacterium]
MSRFLSTMLFLLASAAAIGADPNPLDKQYYEVRTYQLSDSADESALDDYLKKALLPALKRIGVGPVGVFGPAESDENDQSMLVLVIPAKDANQLAEIPASLRSDSEYVDLARKYMDRSGEEALFKRIRSELLIAMDCMPRAEVPVGTLENEDRVYELRLYESATEKLGDLKVDMFNNGEVPIFLDCGIQPIFLGQCVLGPQAPSLTYLTVYPSEEARLEAWKKFRVHPKWQVLKKVAKYKGTVSKIDKYVLRPKPYSEM